MPFQHDSRGIDPSEFRILPEGWYPFKIFDAEEQESKKGYPMVVAKCEVFNDPRYEGIKVWNYITFLPKGQDGAGISVHFRKCIGVPYGGEDTVDSRQWIGKKFMGKVTQATYEGKTRNKFSQISPYDETLIDRQEQKEDQIPF